EKAALIRGYSRLQGLIIRKDNPLNVKSLEDAIEKGAFFINRNPGSGTRILFDMLLEKIAEKRNTQLKELTKEIKGYEVEAKTHSAVASAVSMGKADIGIAIKTALMFYENLEFIPLKEEKYDFLILNDSMDKPGVNLFIKTLKSEDFQKTAEKLEGIKTDENTGKPIQ
ncbi:MAG: substrate-binding domain-containing protein, partial [Candidatus Wukongarchaeota archaeon]|nr:substrate-binding domain-containing protein [Candidatus Wukongarchaeota archaeon]